MRLWLALALPLLAGCVSQEDPAEPSVSAAADALEIPACAPMLAPFEANVTLTDLDARAGSTEVVLYAQQYGRLASVRAHVEPGARAAITLPVSIDRAGAWDIYLTAPTPRAPAQRITIVEGACA